MHTKRTKNAASPLVFRRATIYMPYPAHDKCVVEVSFKICEPERLVVV